MNIIEYFHSNLTQHEIAKLENITRRAVGNRFERIYNKTQRTARKSRMSRQAVSAGKFIKQHNIKGYRVITHPVTHERIGEHVAVMCIALQLAELPKNFVVHHIDGNKSNNQINNLCLLTNTGHNKLHYQR